MRIIVQHRTASACLFGFCDSSIRPRSSLTRNLEWARDCRQTGNSRREIPLAITRSNIRSNSVLSLSFSDWCKRRMARSKTGQAATCLCYNHSVPKYKASTTERIQYLLTTIEFWTRFRAPQRQLLFSPLSFFFFLHNPPGIKIGGKYMFWIFHSLCTDDIAHTNTFRTKIRKITPKR